MVTLDKVATEGVTEEYTCKLEFNAVERDTLGKGNISDPVSFTSDSWKTIQKAVQTGNTSKYHVGDTKEVDLGSLGTHTVRISNMSECTTETSETACGFVVEFADIITKQVFKSTNKNVGGWKDSELRTYVNGTIYNALPSELQNVISSTKVISSHGATYGETNFETQDKLYLLSGHEVYEDGTYNQISTYDTAYSNTKQLDYYKNQGVTADGNAGAIKQYNGSNEYWWLRSAYTYNYGDFIRVYDSGRWANDGAPNSNGISPAFRIA